MKHSPGKPGAHTGPGETGHCYFCFLPGFFDDWFVLEPPTEDAAFTAAADEPELDVPVVESVPDEPVFAKLEFVVVVLEEDDTELVAGATLALAVAGTAWAPRLVL